jgi:hypothetical protein
MTIARSGFSLLPAFDFAFVYSMLPYFGRSVVPADTTAGLVE